MNAPAEQPRRRKKTEASSKHQSHDSDHGTPSEIIEPMREVMGGIDLDPCSSAAFNQVVRAAKFYDASVNGLNQKWSGRVWINAPGGLCDAYGVMLPRDASGKQEIKLPPGEDGKPRRRPRSDYVSAPRLWWQQLMVGWTCKMVTEFGFELFSIELLAKLQKVREPYPKVTEFHFCILRDRVRHMTLDPVTGELVRGKSPTHFSGVVYGGPNVRKFKRLFSSLGATGRLR